MPVLNISAYRFASIKDPDELRTRLVDCATRNDLRGTILIAREGINLALAGASAELRAFWEVLRADPLFADLEGRQSWSSWCPFKQLVVKIKPEIVTMGKPNISPELCPAPRVSAAELKAWLDTGQEVTLLDTRNTFEFEMGRFEGAMHLGNSSFRSFPEAVQAHLPDLSGKKLVTFCTGGIRCEKAAILLRQLGCQASQLDGGILGYFSEVGGAHFAGECFVFDQRGALNCTGESLQRTGQEDCEATSAGLAEAL